MGNNSSSGGGASNNKHDDDEFIMFADKSDTLYQNFKLFVLGKRDLTKEDLEKLSRVRSIPDFFLDATVVPGIYNAESSLRTTVEKVDMSCFNHVTSIGCNFMNGLRALQNVDLSFASNVVEISSNFCFDCGDESKVKEIDVSHLRSLKKIDGRKFLGRFAGQPHLFPMQMKASKKNQKHPQGHLPAQQQHQQQNQHQQNANLSESEKHPVKLVGARHLRNVEVTRNEDPDAIWLKEQIRLALLQEDFAVRSVHLITHKGGKESRLSQVMASEWVVMKLTMKFLLPK